MNPRVAKSQQVPLRYWFLTLVIGISFTVVKVFSFCADAVIAISIAEAIVSIFFMICEFTHYFIT